MPTSIARKKVRFVSSRPNLSSIDPDCVEKNDP